MHCVFLYSKSAEKWNFSKEKHQSNYWSFGDFPLLCVTKLHVSPKLHQSSFFFISFMCSVLVIQFAKLQIYRKLFLNLVVLSIHPSSATHLTTGHKGNSCTQFPRPLASQLGRLWSIPRPYVRSNISRKFTFCPSVSTLGRHLYKPTPTDVPQWKQAETTRKREFTDQCSLFHNYFASIINFTSVWDSL